MPIAYGNKNSLHDNIPFELRDCAQWLCWKYVKVEGKDKLTKPPVNARTGEICNSQDPACWVTFDEAIRLAPHYDGIGFALTKNDPYCCVDFDQVDDEYSRSKQAEVYNKLISYAELSPSGLGCHVICRAAIEGSIQRDWIEIYSHSQYITVTGNMIEGRNQIYDEDAKIQDLYRQAVTSSPDIVVKEWEEPREEDQVVLEKIWNHPLIGERFIPAWEGHFAGRYPSASECRMALMNYIVMFTKNRDQAKRIFMASRCASAPKFARRRDKEKELNRLFMKAHDRILPDLDFSHWIKVAEENAADEKRIEAMIEPQQEVQPQQQVQQVITSTLFNPADYLPPEDMNQIEFPTGLVGELAQYLLDQSRKPIPEAALSMAFGLVAGICGRTFNTYTGLGLNLYIVLLAKTASGKEGPIHGKDKLKLILKESGLYPDMERFLGPTFASGQALVRQINQFPSFVSILDEFGKLWMRMNGYKASTADKELIRVMLEIYSKSGATQSYSAKAYSSKESDLDELRSPAFSFVGFSTPETFFNGFNVDSIEDGFLPRLLVVHYKGDRPYSNRNHIHVKPSNDLLQKMNNLLWATHNSIEHEMPGYVVPITPEAENLDLNYENQIDDMIRQNSDPMLDQIWSRAYANVLKLSTLCAIGDNMTNPIVEARHVNWSINFVNRLLGNIEESRNSGDFGNNVQVSAKKALLKVVKDYMLTDLRTLVQSYKVPEDIAKARAIPVSYIRKRVKNVKPYSHDANMDWLLTRTIATACEDGELAQLEEIEKAQFTKSRAMKLYRLVDANILK